MSLALQNKTGAAIRKSTRRWVMIGRWIPFSPRTSDSSLGQLSSTTEQCAAVQAAEEHGSLFSVQEPLWNW